MKTLQTNRLTLKALTSEEAALVAAYQKRNRAFLENFAPKRDESFYTPVYHEKNLKENPSEKCVRFFLFKQDEEEVVGHIGLSAIIRGGFQSCFLGYDILKSETQKGLMTEALKAVIQFAFEELKLHRIEANIMPSNIASIKLIEKVGFIKESLHKQYLKINGKWEDHFGYVLLNGGLD